MSIPVIETPRIVARALTPQDAAQTSRLMTPAVSRWVASWPVPFTVEMAAERIAIALQRTQERQVMACALLEKASGALIGWASVARHAEDSKRGVFGYWLGEAYHGKGYMKEIGPAIVQAAFGWLDVSVIEAAAQPENTASLKIMQACGMRRVGQGMVYAPARGREELCEFYEVNTTL